MLRSTTGAIALALSLLALVWVFPGRKDERIAFIRGLFRVGTNFPLPVFLGGLAGVASVLLPLLFALLTGRAHLGGVTAIGPAYLALAVMNIGMRFVAAAFEELIFRAGAFLFLSRYIGQPAAVIVSALLFAAAHLAQGYPPDLMASTVLFLDGVSFALVFQATRSLWIAAVWHFSRNFTVWLLGGGSYRLVNGAIPVIYTREDFWTGIGEQFGMMDVVSTLFLTTVTMFLLWRARNESKKLEKGDGLYA